MVFDVDSLDLTLHRACQRLLTARNAQGHWEGELASSPLSTATAVLALALVDEASEQNRTGGKHSASIESGLAWLMGMQNADGGWGDTSLSKSNISTTALVWAVLVALDVGDRWPEARRAVEAWLVDCGGVA